MYQKIAVSAIVFLIDKNFVCAQTQNRPFFLQFCIGEWEWQSAWALCIYAYMLLLDKIVYNKIKVIVYYCHLCGIRFITAFERTGDSRLARAVQVGNVHLQAVHLDTDSRCGLSLILCPSFRMRTGLDQAYQYKNWAHYMNHGTQCIIYIIHTDKIDKYTVRIYTKTVEQKQINMNKTY